MSNLEKTEVTVEKETPVTVEKETPVTVEKETPVTVEKEAVTEKPKRKNKKRKQEIINNFEEKQEEKQEAKQEEKEEETPSNSKRVKITKDVEQQEESEPSLWKGAILKPAMLGILAGASFYVNHVFNTTKPKFRPPAPPKPQQQKKNISNSAPFLRVQARHTVPGFL